MYKTPNIFSSGLAPMEGVTDFPFRLWCHLASQPEFQSTPFLRVTPSFPHKQFPEDFAPELQTGAPYPLVMQMMAKDAENFLRAHALLPQAITSIDINCGCPAPLAVGRGAGSSLLQSPEDFGRTIKELTDAVGPKRLGVKMRLGFADSSRFLELIDAIAPLPLKRVTIHGRTKAAGYKGKADWQLIAAAASRLSQPVWGSGDVNDLASYQLRRSIAPQISSLIIGRGALRNPWLFSELRRQRLISLSPLELCASLICLALLHELWQMRRVELYPLAAKLYPLAGAGFVTLRSEIESTFGDDWQQAELSRFALGRTKMIWSYLRSSLPAPYFEPKILRSRSLKELIDAISACGSERLTLRYQNQYDWLYAGEKKPPRTVAEPSRPLLANN